MAEKRGWSTLALFGVGCFIVALLIGFMPFSVSLTDYNADTNTTTVTGETSCGNAWIAKSASQLSDPSSDVNCQFARGNRLQLVSVFLLAALILFPLGVGGVGGSSRGRWEFRRVDKETASAPSPPASTPSSPTEGFNP
jgi:hypothetical protein